MRPFYDLIANIAAEEFGHIELVSYAINLLLTGTTERGDDPSGTPLAAAADARNTYHFLASGQQALPMDSQGNFWTGANVFSSGNLKLDLLHNFFLECGARAGKIRVYETVEDPTARACVGFLLVRGGVHIVAYAKALEKLRASMSASSSRSPISATSASPRRRSMRRKASTAFCISSARGTIRRWAKSGMANTRRTGVIWKWKSGPRRLRSAGPRCRAPAHRSDRP